MDPFSLASGVVGIIGLTIQVSKIVNTYYHSAKNSAAAASELLASLTILGATLKHLDTFLCNENAKNHSFEQTSVLCCATAACKTRLELLHSKLSKHNNSRLARAIEHLKWPFNEQENRTQVSDLQGFVQTFQFSLTIDGCALLSKTSNEVSDVLRSQLETFKRLEEIPSYFSTLSINVSKEMEQISQILNIVASLPDTSLQLQSISGSLQRVEQKLEDQGEQALRHKREEVLKWLSALEYQNVHNDVCSRRLQHTGQWLLERKEFRVWSEDHRSAKTLWCHGIPGAGKTIMSSLVIDHLRKTLANQDSAVVFFYFDYRSQDIHSPEYVSASLLKQLAILKPDLPLSVSELYTRSKQHGNHPQLHDLQTALLSVLREFPRAYLVIDALDECDAKKYRKTFFKLLKCLTTTNARVFVTSRPHPDDIKQGLSAYPQIKVEASEADIRKFLAHTIDEDGDEDLIDEQMKDEIVGSIANTAQGMFLLPALQIQTILDQTTKKKIRRLIKEMPKELDAILQKTFERINKQPESPAELGMKTLMWISYARRPLKVKELCQALAVNLGETCLDEDDRPLAKHMVDYSLGLVTIDEESAVIRLVHFSVEEYFREKREQMFPMGEHTISKTCLTYLLFEDFRDGACTTDADLETRNHKNPFLSYSSIYWSSHIQDTADEGGKLALEFLTRDHNLACSLQVFHTVGLPRTNGYSQAYPKKQTGLHFAATLGLDTLVAPLLSRRDTDPDSRDTFDCTPLSYAARKGHLTVVQQLLESGHVLPDTKDCNGRSPFSFAAGNGHVSVAKLLVRCDGVDLNSRVTQSGRTALSYAAEYGHEAIVRLLLGFDAIDPDAKDIEFRTPLWYASTNGYEDIVRLLLEANVNADSKTKDGQTPLSQAVKTRNESVVELLLEKAKDLNSVETKHGLTPLLWAVRKKHAGLVKTLLNKGADVNGRGKYGWTPLFGAVDFKCKIIIQILLEHPDLDINAKDEYGCTALSRAADQGSTVMVELLLSCRDIDVESRDRYGQTPLSRAATNGHEEVVKLLLNCEETNVECKDNQGQTPMSRASERGHEAVVTLLLGSQAVVQTLEVDSHIDLDSIIDRLLEARFTWHAGVSVLLLEKEILCLCAEAKKSFLFQPMLLELKAPINICGDIRGQYSSLSRVFESCGFPSEQSYLFLGNYVKRGREPIEVICLLLAYKIKYPETFFMLRGNHECASINRIYGFYDACKKRKMLKLWKVFNDCFNCMPVAAIIDEQIFAVHGGLSPDLNSMDQIRNIQRPTDIPDCGLLCDLVWADPDIDIKGWSMNDRGVSFTFGPDVVSRFLQKHKMTLICRGHQIAEDGREFFAGRQLVTLFTAPNYIREFDNAGAVMSVDENLVCSFHILKCLLD